ncbi:MAG: hypothetical protein ACIAQ0_02430 [Phycisphaerales bacterium JB058]
MNLRTSLVAIAFSLAGFFSAPVALAQDDRTESAPDVVILKDGTEIRGTIVKELIGYVWIDVGGEEEKFLSPGEIESFTRTSAPEPTHKNQQDQTLVGKPEQWERVPGVTRAAILTAEGMVGLQFAAKPLREAIPMLKAEGIDLVVIKVNSGGGMLLEVQAISDVLHDEYKPEFALVGWVDSAILEAAAAVFSIDRVVFLKKGNWGGAHDWGGFGGRGEQRAKAAENFMRIVSERGGYPEYVLRSVFGAGPLSCDVDLSTGKPIFRNDERGNIDLCGPGEYLSLNSVSAKACGFSDGTADTLEELTALLKPNHGKIVWVGKKFQGVPFPLCMAERHLRAYRNEIDYQEEQFGVIFTKYLTELENSKNASIDRRDHSLRRAEQYLARIQQIVRINPNLGLVNDLADDWFAQQEEHIARLRDE